MLTQTVERLPELVEYENIIVLTNQEQREAVVESCPMLPAKNIIAEPEGRDTAAAVGLAALVVAQRNPDATIAMLPADHVIHDAAGFRDVLKAAFAAAEERPRLVTLGIKPTEPATGYGYIHRGKELTEFGGHAVFAVERFVEKPQLATAKEYLASGDYLWNAGMFVWGVATIRDAMQKYAPEVAAGIGAVEEACRAGQSLDAALAAHFPAIEKISIDFAVMEQADNVVTIATTFDWDDVGEWPAVMRHFTPDKSGNVIRGDAIVNGGGGNLVVSGKDHLVAVVGVDDLIVVHTPDATLVCPKSQAQNVKGIVQQLGDQPRFKHLL